MRLYPVAPLLSPCVANKDTVLPLGGVKSVSHLYLCSKARYCWSTSIEQIVARIYSEKTQKLSDQKDGTVFALDGYVHHFKHGL